MGRATPNEPISIDASARNIDGMIEELREMGQKRMGQLELNLNDASPD